MIVRVRDRKRVQLGEVGGDEGVYVRRDRQGVKKREGVYGGGGEWGMKMGG